jgi:pimeloyl-ACP methyl ester carboxylesterase
MKIELAFDRIDGLRAERTIVFLHGILGRGHNLRTIARRFIEARPDWTALLVDLRGHGRSPKGLPGASLEAAAADVVNVVRRASHPVATVVGHSFGGKVALEAARIGSTASLEHVVVIDSMPGSQPQVRSDDSALTVIDTIASLPPALASKADFIEALIATGKTRTLAQWLAQSVEKMDDGFRFMLDLDEIRALVLDYYSRDLWPVVEDPPVGVRVHLVIGDRSDAYSPEERLRATRLASSSERVTVDVLPAGHWVHVDDPEGLLRILLDRIRAG